MRMRIDNPVGVWLAFLFIIIPIFLGSFKSNWYTWELKVTSWLIMSLSIYGLFEFYVTQGGSNYGPAM